MEFGLKSLLAAGLEQARDRNESKRRIFVDICKMENPYESMVSIVSGEKTCFFIAKLVLVPCELRPDIPHQHSAGFAPRLSGGVAGAAEILQEHCPRSLGALTNLSM